MIERFPLFLWKKENIVIIILLCYIVESECIINTSICWYKIKYLIKCTIQMLINEEIETVTTKVTLIQFSVY